jgi:hypothetical protein
MGGGFLNIYGSERYTWSYLSNNEEPATVN